ncbi:MAG TPA: hypothetical protein VNC60_00375 [Actinomycetota bacterium]|nr:hypothetical protein [Actinomycetota bacterium]
METSGLFRTRVARDGAVEVWARGWRLESQVPALVPTLIAVGFLFSPFSLHVRTAGAVVLFACAWVMLRMSRLGFRVDVAGVQLVDVVRTHRVVWDRVAGFVGERNGHEGRCVLLTTDGYRLRSPGTLDPDEMDPFWAQGDVSAVDQLNRLMARLRRALTTAGSAPERAPFLDLREDARAEEAPSPGARRLRALG